MTATVVHHAICDPDSGEAYAHIGPPPWQPWAAAVIDIIQRHRVARGWSVAQLADHAGRDAQAIRGVLTGKTALSVPTAEQLLAAVGLRLDPPTVSPIPAEESR
jgi:Helix-turn-helix domain